MRWLLCFLMFSLCPPIQSADRRRAMELYKRQRTGAAAVTYEWVTNYTATTLRNDFAGWAGGQGTCKSNGVVVTALGRWIVAGNSGTHTVKLRDISNGLDLGSVSVNTVGATAGAFKYVDLASPINLVLNDAYAIISEEATLGDQWYNVGASGAAKVQYGFLTADNDAYSVDGTSILSVGTGTNSLFVPVSLKFR